MNHYNNNLFSTLHKVSLEYINFTKLVLLHKNNNWALERASQQVGFSRSWTSSFSAYTSVYISTRSLVGRTLRMNTLNLYSCK